MNKRLIRLLVSVGFLLVAPVSAAEPDTRQAGTDNHELAEWRGRTVMAKSAGVVCREQPDEQAPTIAGSLAGIWLDVEEAQGDWLKTEDGWVRISEIARDGEVVDYFTARLAEGPSVFSLLGRARGWLERNDFDKAQADVSEALRLDPQNARAFFVLAKIAAAQQRPDEELANYDQALRHDPRDCVALRARGRLLGDRRDFDRAINDCNTAIAIFPGDFRHWANRGWCYANKSDNDQAMADFTEALRLNPGYAYAYCVRAVLRLRRGELRDAMADAEEAVRLDPKLAYAVGTRGAVRSAENQLDAAIRDLDAAIRLDGNQASYYVERGRAHFRKEEWDAAVLDYTQAITLDGSNPDFYLERAEVWSRKRDDTNAIIDLTECLKLRPQARVYQRRAQLHMQKGENDLAIEDLTAGIAADPKSVSCLVNRAMMWIVKRELQKAIDDCHAALAIDPDSAAAYSRLAAAHTMSSNFDEALATYTAGLAKNPNHVELLINRAGMFTLQEKFDLALADVEKAIRVDAKNANAYDCRGQIWSNKHEWEKAVADFGEAIRLNPYNVSARCLRAQCWIELKQFDKAIADADEALRLNPNSALAEDVRQQAEEAKNGTPDDSQWIGQEVLPKAPDVALDLGEKTIPAAAAGILQVQMVQQVKRVGLLYLAGGWLQKSQAVLLAQAEDYFSQQIEKEPTAFAYAMRGRARADLGKVDAAIADCDAALRLDAACALAYCYRGWAHAARFEYALAESDYSEAIRLEPKLVAAYAWRGRARQRLGKKDLAIKDFDEALRMNPGDLGTGNRRFLASSEGSSLLMITPQRPRDAEDFYFRAMHREWLQQNSDGALDDLRESLRLGLKTAEIYSFRSILYAKRGEFAEAISDLDAAAKFDAANPSLQINRGLAYGELGQYAKAMDDFRRALDGDPDSPTTLSDCWREDGPFQARIASAKKGEGDVDLPAAYCVRAMMWISKGEDGDAIDDLTVAVQLDPKLALAYCLRGWLRRKAGQRDEALHDFAEALRLDPGFAAARRLRESPPSEASPPAGPVAIAEAAPDGYSAAADAPAFAQPAAGYAAAAYGVPLEEADPAKLAAANEALRLNPDDANASERRTSILSALVNRGLKRSRAGRFEEAIRDLDEVVRNDPKNPVNFQVRAQVRFESGAYAKALADYEQALKLAAREFRPIVHADMARLWATCPDPTFRDGKRAVAAAKKSLRAVGFIPPTYYDTLAAAYAECGDFAEAVRWQTKAVETAEGDDAFKREARERLDFYRAGRPYRQSPPSKSSEAAK